MASSAERLADDSDLSRRSFLAITAAAAASLAGVPQISAGQGGGDDVTRLSLQDVAEQVRRKRISPVELTKSCLARIERLNPTLNAFITVSAESALAAARVAEAEIQRGRWRGPLHGIPIALKDLFDTAGVRTTAASALYKDRVPAEDAEVVRRLRAAGAVILGKTNMHEFAYGGTSAVSYFGAVHNPWNSRSHRRWLLGRIGSRGGRGALLRSARLRHRRVHQAACRVLRHCRVETNVWAREHARRDSALVDLRSRRAHRAHRHRRRTSCYRLSPAMIRSMSGVG